jgi:NAD(P)-dependent dehydrogenase (short-subunit alcohol dehydrogenase family)
MWKKGIQQEKLQSGLTNSKTIIMKTALVTGASKGLGFEWCRQLAKQGYKVVLTARDLQRAQEAAEKLKEQELVVYPKGLEVTDEAQLKEIAKWTAEMFGRLDLIVNNAGVNPKDFSTNQKWQRHFI